MLNANHRVNGSYIELTTTTHVGGDSEWVGGGDGGLVQRRIRMSNKQLILSATAHGIAMSIR